MIHIFTKRNKISLAVLSFGLCFMQTAQAADDEFTIYEAEKMTLLNYSVESVEGASNGSLITLDEDFGSATLVINKPSGYYDMQLTYILDDEGEYAFEIYINDVLVDAWMADQNTGFYNEDPLKRVTHITQNIRLFGTKNIEIVGYASNGESCKIDNFGLRLSTAEDFSCNMTWSPSGTISNLFLDGTNRISSGSGLIFNVFDGYSVKSSDLGTASSSQQVVVLVEDYEYARFTLRVERFDYHVRLKLIGLDCVPQGDESLGLKLIIPCSSEVNYELLDDKVEVEKSGTEISVYWTKLAERNLLPGGYLALYAATNETEALKEINNLDELSDELTEPTDIFLSSTMISENNSIGDTIGTLSAIDPQGDIDSYALVSGDGDKDNDKFIIEGDVLKAAAGFDYETSSLMNVRIQVIDSISNTFEKQFTIEILDDESDNDTGANIQTIHGQINVYPNPTGAELFIEGAKEKTTVKVTNLDGKLLYEAKIDTNRGIVDLSKFPSGTYFIKLANEYYEEVKKIVKQ